VKPFRSLACQEITILAYSFGGICKQQKKKKIKDLKGKIKFSANYDYKKERNKIDLIIAETALENNLYILHNDYTNIAKTITGLKIY
jgi:hypothetical protein